MVKRKFVCGMDEREKRTSLSSSVVHARPSFATRRCLRSNAQFFIFSYAMNCSAPLPTPTSASSVPRYSPAQPSSRNIARNPPAKTRPSHHNTKKDERGTYSRARDAPQASWAAR